MDHNDLARYERRRARERAAERAELPRLVDEATGRELKVGETVTTFRGEKMILTGGQPPRHEGSSGRVYLCPPGARRFTNTAEFYPGVINAKWVRR
jgi:hypothetical protein